MSKAFPGNIFNPSHTGSLPCGVQHVL
jgi:hypothetical protein